MPDIPIIETPAASLCSATGSRLPRDAGRHGSRTLIETAPTTDQVREAVDHWHVIRGETSIPHRRALDPLDIPALLSHSELIGVLGPPLDFRYRLIGDVIDRISRDYYVGKRVSEIPSQRPPSLIFELYAETVRRGAPVCVALPYVGEDRFIDHVEVVTMPLAEDSGRVETLWGVVVPAETNPESR